jgi:tetratricopeptide (TPR) repeat protein
MGFLDKLMGLFTKGGRDDALLVKGLEQAKAKQPEQAIATYNQLLNSHATTASTRARALFNRALAYSAMDDDVHAIADLTEVLKLPGLPENVQAAARTQLARVRKRGER